MKILSLRPGISRACLLLGLVLTGVTASAQTIVLDDYSSDLFSTDYVQKPVTGFTPGGWNVTGGVLAPNTATAGGYAAFTWTSDALRNDGDSFSIDVSIAEVAGDHNGGLSLWSSNSDAVFDRVLEPRLAYNGTYSFVGSDQHTQLWTQTVDNSIASQGMTLTLTLLSHSGSSAVVSATLSGASGFTFSQDYALDGFGGALYVGPSAWQADGSNVTFDNLAYTSAVPEPSTYALIFGLATVAFILWRRRRVAPVG